MLGSGREDSKYRYKANGKTKSRGLNSDGSTTTLFLAYDLKFLEDIFSRFSVTFSIHILHLPNDSFLKSITG